MFGLSFAMAEGIVDAGEEHGLEAESDDVEGMVEYHLIIGDAGFRCSLHAHVD